MSTSLRPGVILSFLLLFIGTRLSAQITATINVEGTPRSYIYYIPASAPLDEPLPLVFALHGFTQNANTMMTGSGFNVLADEEGFIVVYPNGINNSWNASSDLPGGSTANDVGFISALMDTMILHYNADPTRMYSCGFSNGGFMSYELACKLADRLAAVASVAGTMTALSYTNCDPTHPMPVLHIHGTSDFIVNYNGAMGNSSVNDVINLWVDHNAISGNPAITLLPDVVQEGSTVEQQVYGPGTDSAEVQLLRIIGGGHTWPGYTGFFGLGNVNRDIKAEREIWQFFKRFSRPESVSDVDSGQFIPSGLFPNPARDQLILTNPDILYIRIVNAFGNIILDGPFVYPIDLNKFDAGWHVILGFNAQKELIYTDKFFKVN